MVWFFGHKACGILALRPGIKPIPPALEGEVLTTGPPGQSFYPVLQPQKGWQESWSWHSLFLIVDGVSGSWLFSSTALHPGWV